MFGRLKKVLNKVFELNNTVDKYKKDTVIQSIPTLTYVNKAKKLIETNEFVQAEEVLKKALELPQEDALVYKYLGLVYEKLSQFDKAVENYQKSAHLSPHDKQIWMRLGFALLALNEYERAEKSFDNANKISVRNAEVYMGWGMALMKQKKYKQAHEKFSTASSLNKYNLYAVFLCAFIEIKLEQYDKAESKLAFLVNISPNASNTFEYARLKAIKKDYNNAVYYAKKSLEYSSEMFPAYILLGQLYMYCLDEENSLKAFQTAHEKGLDSCELYYEWGNALIAFAKYCEAKEKLIKAYDIEPDAININVRLAFCYAQSKDYEKAQHFLEKVLDKEPENLFAIQVQGIVAYENGDWEKAINYFRKNDEDYLNCYYLAKCYEKLDNESKTKEFYEASLLLNPKNVTVYTDYVNYLIEKSEFAQAQRKLRKILKYQQNNTVLLNLMFFVSYILVKDNVCEYNIKETISIAQKIEEINPELFEYPEQKAELQKLLERD